MTTPCEQNYQLCPIFRTMSPEERQHVLQLAEYQNFRIGSSIIREKATVPSGLWMLRSGQCEVVCLLNSGGEQQMAFLNPGAIFGEMSLFDPGPHSATVRAVTECELMFLSAEKIELLQSTDLVAALKLTKNMGRMMAGKLRRMDYYKFDLFPVSPVISGNSEATLSTPAE